MKKHILASIIWGVIGISLLIGCNRVEQIKPTDSDVKGAVCQDYKELLENWAKTQSLLEIDRVSLECLEDSLLMKEDKNERDPNNVTLDISLYYDPKQITGNEQTIIDQICEQLRMTLRSPRVREINVACYNSVDNIGRYGINSMNFAIVDSSLKVEQSEEELKVQTIVYDFVSDWNDTETKNNNTGYPHELITLSHFGIKPETNELYIEIRVYSSNLENTEFLKETMEEKSEELYRKIILDNVADTYLADNKMKQITVVFCTDGNMDDKYYSFRFDIEG